MLAAVKAKEEVDAAATAEAAQESAQRAAEEAACSAEVAKNATAEAQAAKKLVRAKENAAQKAHKTKAEEEFESVAKSQSSWLGSFFSGREKNPAARAWEAEMAT